MKKRKIVLVDDEPHILDSLTRVLRKGDYEIFKCQSALEAWNVINTNEGQIDLIISDNKMPQVGGVDLLVEIKNKYPDIIRIMLTGQSSLADAQKAINEGEIYKFLSKPCSGEEMAVVVKHALAHRDLWLENQRLLKQVRKQETVIETIKAQNPQIAMEGQDEDGSFVIDDEGLSFDDFMKRYS